MVIIHEEEDDLTPYGNSPVKHFPPGNIHRPQQSKGHDELLGNIQDRDAECRHHIH